MNEKYLNDELKEYYDNDFKKVLDIQSSEQNKEFKNSWEVDHHIRQTLIKINSNKNVATLYSKYYVRKYNDDGYLIYSSNSYLRFCYRENIELELFRGFISRLSQKYYTNKYSKFSFEHHTDKINVNKGSKKGIGCIDNPEYFKVNCIQVDFDSSLPEEHKEFWEFLGEELGNI